SSYLFKTSNPIDVLKTLSFNYKFKNFYIADLDGIINHKPNFQLLSKILQIPGIRVMIDPGITEIKDLLDFIKFDINKLIIGLETVQNWGVIQEALRLLGENRLIISLDMYKEKVISKAESIKNKSLIEIVKILRENGVNNLILLDLYRVGQKIGGIPQQYLKIKDFFNGKVYVGGGIRDFKDLMKYEELRFSGVLLATALYDGTIDIERLRKY
ncbi:MAG: HisA/HisF-related TIM barrel protein, partial [Candidatus Thorarchaeota archaeon]